MKKQILAIAGLALAAGGALAPNITGPSSASQPTIQQGNNGNGQQAQQNNPIPSQTQGVQQRVIAKDRFRPTEPLSYANYGVPPKEWGQYLQRTGKQKWTKSRRA